MPSASLTSKGQITIPKAIREVMGVKTGDRVDFSVEGDVVVLRPGTTACCGVSYTVQAGNGSRWPRWTPPFQKLTPE
jgi:AbrB family looped-hinge helix DNA binding protein